MPKNAPSILPSAYKLKTIRWNLRFRFLIKYYHVRNYNRGLSMSDLIKPLISTHLFAQNYSNKIKGVNWFQLSPDGKLYNSNQLGAHFRAARTWKQTTVNFYQDFTLFLIKCTWKCPWYGHKFLNSTIHELKHVLSHYKLPACQKMNHRLF